MNRVVSDREERARTLEEFEALPPEEQEEIREEARDSGKKVFALDYDSGAPGGGGQDWVMKHRGLFFVFSLDDHPPGPFATLRDALVGGHLTDVTTATVEILCKGMPVKELLGLLEVHDAEVELVINDRAWAYETKSGWRRK